MDAELDRDLALLAGWLPGQDYGSYPDYSTSIDAQHRDLDPLLIECHGLIEERHYPPRDGFSDHEHVFHTRSGSFVGYAPEWAEARARAIKAALEAKG